jgi:hypothetical protein
MRNSAYHLLKQIKNASAMGAGSFMPPSPLPNSVKAKQIEQQELAAQQGEANAGAGNEQLMQMQKAQEDAVNQLQQTQQQLAQVQGELQNSQAQSQQQQQAIQMQAQQEIQKAQMDAQYELQSEKIKNQQKLLSVQEKYMRSAGKAKPDQNHILGNQLKRVVKKVNSLKVASTAPPTPLNPTGGPRDSVIQKKDSDIQANEKKFQGLPHSSVLPSQRTQQQWNEISDWKKNRIQTDPGMQQTKSQVMAAPSKTPGLIEGYGTAFKDYLDNPWKETERMQTDVFGDYSVTNPGSIGRLAMDMYTGFVPNLVGGISETVKGIGSGDAMRALKGVGTAGLGLGAGALTVLSGGAAPFLLKGPGKFVATQAAKRLPGFVSKTLPKVNPGKFLAKNRLAQGAINAVAGIGAYQGLNALGEMGGLGDPNVYNENNYDGQTEDYQYMNGGYSGGGQAPGGVSYPGGFSAPQPQQRWDVGLSPSERFQVLNQAQKAGMHKGANILNIVKGFTAKSGADSDTNQLYRPPVKQPEYPDIRKFMKNPPPPGEAISSPVPIWQSGFKQHDLNMPRTRQQGYGPLGDFIKQLIFQVGLPMFGIRNPLSPDFSKVYGSLADNEAYKLKVPQTFNYY